MRSAVCWKVLIGVGLIAFVLDCAPKRIQTQFSKNKEAEYGQDYTPEQMRAALGADRYEVLVAGIGQDNLNALMYGIGQSNMVSLMNAITGPGKLVSLMSDGPNSRKLTSTEVLDVLLKLDAAVSQPRQSLYQESTSTDTIGKMANMINTVTVAGMEGIKNIVHGVQDQPADLNGVYYQNRIARLGFLIALLKDAGAIMPNLVNNLAAPGGTFSATGNAKLIRMVNQSLDMRDLGVIINTTNSLNNITDTLLGLTGGMYCSKPEYVTQATCTGAGGSWTNTLCNNAANTINYPQYTTRAACQAAGQVWTADGIDNMGRMINELDRVCSNSSYTNGYACISAGATWYTKAAKIPVIINNINNVPNMYTIVNGLTNDGKRPAWPSGQPAPYAGDLGNVFDGVDSMVATINTINVAAMGDPANANTVPYGLNGVLRLAYLVNNLDTTPIYGNDTNFDETTGGFNCVTGNFDNRLNWAFSNNGSASAPFSGKSWASDNNSAQSGTCSIRNDPTAATVQTQTQSAELVANLTTAGNITFYRRTALNTGDILRFYIDDVQQTCASCTGTQAWSQLSFAVGTGVHRFRWDVQRRLNSTGQVWIDTVVLPGDKGAARTAAQKTFIMLNNLYINSSLTNVADILSNTTAPACIATPSSCTPTWNNGVDTLIHTVNRVEYPAVITDAPRLAVTVNQISSLQIMYDILNNMDSQNSTNQLVAMMDFVQTPASLPTLINALTGQAGVRTADILKNLNAAGTSNMLRVLADTPNGAPVLDTARLLNGVTNTIRVAEILNELKLSANVYNTTSATVTITAANPAVVTWTGAHGLVQNARVSISTTGKLPDGLFSGRVYYACQTSDNTALPANTFQLSTDQTCASRVSTLGGTQSGTHTAMAGDETAFASPNRTGGQKLAEFFNAVNSKGSGSANTCNVNDNEDDFCIKNHLVRLVNDIATSASGSQTVADIVSNLRPNAGPGGNAGVTRMVDVLFEMKNQTSGSPYTNPLSNSTAEDFGRLTAFIKDMTGGNAGLNTARMVNEVNLGYMSTRVTWLLKNINRMRYLSRLLSEMTSVDLMLQLLNDSATNISSIDNLVDTHGNNTYGAGAIGSADPSPKYGANPSGYNCATADCDTNTTDQLGRLIQMINNIYAIGNTLTLINGVQDITYISYLIINANRIKYMTDIVNRLTNVDLLVKILNGADACTVYAPGINDTSVTDTQTNCTNPTPTGAGGRWFGVGKCKTNPALTTVATCGVANWEGAERAKLLALVNGIGNSELRGNVGAGDLVGAGTNTKAIGDEYVLADTVNQLGYSGSTPRSIGQQMRVVRVINQGHYCGLKPQYDKRIQSGPVCVNSNLTTAADSAIVYEYQHEEACKAAGFWWKSKWNNAGTSNWVSAETSGANSPPVMFYTCPNSTYTKPAVGPQTPGVYFANGDRYDGRNRLVTMMLGVLDGAAFSTVVGDVQDTLKTVNMVNGVRRIRTLSQFVKWVPGPVTAALVNNTDSAAVLRSLVYLANNLEDDEDSTAKAFAQMVHFGVKIVAQGKESAAPTCLEFTGLGPRRLAAVMNLEAGPYLEGLVSNLGWNMATAAMNCGWARDSGENTGNCSAEDNATPGGTDPSGSGPGTGGMYKSVGASYTGTPKPTAPQCVRPRELTAGYRYGNYTWGSGQGIIQANCMSLMPESSGLSICDAVTDSMIWNGFSSVDDGIGDSGCPGATCDDMWSVLKGQGGGLVGSLMDSGSSYVGFPPPRVYSDTENATGGLKGGTTSACSNGSNNGDNWQCVRAGLKLGDLRPNDTGTGYYWGTYCAAGDSTNVAGITGGAGTSTLAYNCINNGGSWHTEKNYQGPSCNVDPSLGVKIGP
ncbi:MAG: hypothetical protein J0L53_08345 [Spirochaetes bacterium]|nr:hypothetical protein [Spirochaetota bacterium]